LYAVVDTVANISGITAAQIKAGQNNSGAAAAISGSSSVSTLRPVVPISGISSGTLYGLALVHTASADSNVLTGSFTVDSNPVSVPLVYQHVGGGGNPYSRGNAGNTYKCPLPEASGPNNHYVFAFTCLGGATVSSVAGVVCGSLGAPVVSALAGSGYQDSRAYVVEVPVINFSAGISAGATSANLASSWTGSSATIVLRFSDGEQRSCSFTSGSTSVTWSGALNNNVSSNARANETIIVTLGASERVFQYVVTELYGIDPTGTIAGSSSVANNTTIGAGTFIPVNNDATGGNFIWSYFVKAVQQPASNTTSIAAGGSATLLNADVGWNSATDSIPKAVQGYIQSSAAAINPAISSASDTADGWNSLAIALKINLSAGTPPTGDIRIQKIDHFGTLHYPTSGTYTLQCPSIGNFRYIQCNDPALKATTITDSDGNTYLNAGAPSNPNPTGIWYLPNVGSNPNLKIYVAGGGTTAGLSFRFVDVVNASTAPFDSVVTSAQSIGSVTSFSSSPSPSPDSSYGLAIANMGLNLGPGLAITSPSGAVFDFCTYSGETDLDLIENADLMAHYRYLASGAQTWTWSITSQTGNTTSGGTILLTGSGPSPTISTSTPSGTVAGNTQSIGCTTDTTSGTLYVVVDTIDNILGVSATQILAGQNNAGSPAAFSGSGAVSTTSPSVSISGLSTGTTYGFALCQVGSANSNVLMGQFAVNTHSSSYTMAGGLTLSGTSPEIRSVARLAAGGLLLGGAAGEQRAAVRSPSGGLLFSGIGQKSSGRQVSTSGGIAFAGAASAARASHPATSGGLTFSGSATESSSRQQYSYIGSGGIVLSGAALASYHIAKVTVTMAGGITFSGGASVSYFTNGGEAIASPWCATDASIGGVHLFRLAETFH